MPKYSQQGFAPIIIIILLAIIGASLALIIKNTPFNQPQPTVDKGFQASSSGEIKVSPTISPTTTKSNSKSPTPTKKTTPTPTNTPSNSNNDNSNNSNPTSTPTQTPVATITPTPTPKTYTYNGNNINATTICDQNSQNTFNVQIGGYVTPQGYDKGIWTTLTGNGTTIITSYDAGAGPTQPIRVAISSTGGSIGAIRGGSSMTLRMSNSSNTYGYELKAYEAPYTDGVPNLSSPIGDVSFMTDCR